MTGTGATGTVTLSRTGRLGGTLDGRPVRDDAGSVSGGGSTAAAASAGALQTLARALR